MAQIEPFQAYRYAEKAGNLADLVTQPYDKITPEMQARYLSLSPYNLVRVILGERFDTDSESNSVYTRAAQFFRDWIDQGLLQKDAERGFYAYFQQFKVPDSDETLIRKGFIGLGRIEDYSAGVVYRHEQTLSGPKKDRRQVLEHTRAHFGQIFMLYADPERGIDALLDRAAQSGPAASVVDEYDTLHTLYRITDAATISEIQKLMSDKKLLIADGHHRYETALSFRDDHPDLEDAKFVMMTFVNMHAPGLRILATHRVLSGLTDFDSKAFLDRISTGFKLQKVDSAAALKQLWEQPAPEKLRIAIAIAGDESIYVLERDRNGQLDVRVLHEELLEDALGIASEAVRDEHFIKYVRGLENAADMVADGKAQIAFLLEPTTIDQVAETSFGGGVMPQKSTDFYPKLLTGITIYRLEK